VNEHGELLAELAARVLEASVALTVPHHEVSPAPGRSRSRRPQAAVFVVAHVQHLARRVDDRIVVPRRQPVALAVTEPGEARARLGHDRAEVRVRKHVAPGRGRRGRRLERHDVFATRLVEAAETIVEGEPRPLWT
jgi:hypothetical protein